MRLLLDSHAFLWFLLDAPKLSPSAEKAIGEAEEVHLSLASLWELALKRGLRRLTVHEEPDKMAVRAGFSLLPIKLAHIHVLQTLPQLHRDPFDRMLVAQAVDEGLVLVTADTTLQRYPVAWLW
jgi:PIN domain nuclease of toxin-antitoxin system